MKVQIIPVGKNKAIAVEPLGTLWISVEKSDARRWMKRRGQDDKIAYTDRVKRTWVAGANPIGAPRAQISGERRIDLLTSKLTRVTRVCFSDNIRSESADGVDRDCISRGRDKVGHG